MMLQKKIAKKRSEPVSCRKDLVRIIFVPIKNRRKQEAYDDLVRMTGLEPTQYCYH